MRHETEETLLLLRRLRPAYPCRLRCAPDVFADLAAILTDDPGPTGWSPEPELPVVVDYELPRRAWHFEPLPAGSRGGGGTTP